MDDAELKQRTKMLAIRILRLYRALPRMAEANILGNYYVPVHPSAQTIGPHAARVRALNF